MVGADRQRGEGRRDPHGRYAEVHEDVREVAAVADPGGESEIQPCEYDLDEVCGQYGDRRHTVASEGA